MTSPAGPVTFRTAVTPPSAVPPAFVSPTPDSHEFASKKLRRDPPQPAAFSFSAQPIRRSAYFRCKFIVDRLIAAPLALVAFPVMALVAALILIFDGRPVFYRQIRTGRNGHQFRIWKFRTMTPDAEQHTGAVWSRNGDPRVTTIGRWLRCTHLDELPQFFNIVVGDMNLVGPRPERPEFIVELSRDIPDYLDRLAVRPGLTGLAQLELGYDESVAEVASKVKLDRHYIQTATPLEDIRLLMGTLPYIVRQLSNKLRHRKANAAVDESHEAASSDRRVA